MEMVAQIRPAVIEINRNDMTVRPYRHKTAARQSSRIILHNLIICWDMLTAACIGLNAGARHAGRVGDQPDAK